MKTGFKKGHKEYAGAYKGIKGKEYPKTVIDSHVDTPKPTFKPYGEQPKKEKGRGY